MSGRRPDVGAGGAKYLEKVFGGGILLGGAPASRPGEVVIIGGGVVGINAAKMAWSGRPRHHPDISLDRLRYLDDVPPGERGHRLQPTATTSWMPSAGPTWSSGRCCSPAKAPTW